MKIEILKPRIDAALAAETMNSEARTIELQFYSGGTVRRYSWVSGTYLLAFSMEADHVRLGRLNSGRAPVLETHSDWSTQDVLGVVEEGWLAKGRGMARARFALNDAAADRVWNKIEQKILRNVSMGAVIHKLKELSTEEDKIKSYLAVDWEPLEISIVPIGADPEAQVMSGEDGSTMSVELELAAGATAQEGEQTMEQPNVEQASQAAQAAERSRVLEITKIANLGKLDATFAATHVEAGTSVEEFRRLAYDKLAARSGINPTREHHGEIMRDQVDTRRELAMTAVMGLMSPAKYKLDNQNPFRGMGILRMAEEILAQAGERVRGMNRTDIANLSMQKTSDFPYILEASARKIMMDAYGVAEPTYKIWAKASTAPDFRMMSRTRLSEMPSFRVVAEGAQITIGPLTESREQYAIVTAGRGVSFSRQLIINDDMGAFTDLITAFGFQARRWENMTVYAVLKANAAMADGVALFHATHGNLGTGVIANTGLDAAFGAVGAQKGSDGQTVLNLMPKFLLVPTTLATTATNAMIAIPMVKLTDQNWFAGRLTVVADAELNSISPAWFLVGDPQIAPAVEYAHLEGAEGPQILRKDNEDAILGVQLYCYTDFGAKAVDWRPLYKSSGV